VRSFYNFALPANSLSGGLPANITAFHFDVSFNFMSGPIFMHELTFTDGTHVKYLNFAHNPGFSCPILLNELEHVGHLDIENSGIVGCDLQDKIQVQVHWSNITALLLSNNAFAPWHLVIQPGNKDVKAQFANIISFLVPSDRSSYILTDLQLDGNPLEPDLQLQSFNSLSYVYGTLERFSCEQCGIQLTMDEVTVPFSFWLQNAIYVAPALSFFSLSMNNLQGQSSFMHAAIKIS
jgi:hypothetical protein